MCQTGSLRTVQVWIISIDNVNMEGQVCKREEKTGSTAGIHQTLLGYMGRQVAGALVLFYTEVLHLSR